MRNSVLPVMGVLTIIAGAVGLQLGESAIAQIDPLYFEGSAPPPRDVTKEPRAQRPAGFAEATGWAEGYAARDAECPGCGAVAAAASPAPLFEYSDPTIAPRWEHAVAELSPDDLRIDRSIHSAEVQRYLHYPVSADQAELRAGLDGAAPEPEVELAADEPTGL